MPRSPRTRQPPCDPLLERGRRVRHQGRRTASLRTTRGALRMTVLCLANFTFRHVHPASLAAAREKPFPRRLLPGASVPVSRFPALGPLQAMTCNIPQITLPIRSCQGKLLKINLSTEGAVDCRVAGAERVFEHRPSFPASLNRGGGGRRGDPQPPPQPPDAWWRGCCDVSTFQPRI